MTPRSEWADPAHCQAAIRAGPCASIPFTAATGAFHYGPLSAIPIDHTRKWELGSKYQLLERYVLATAIVVDSKEAVNLMSPFVLFCLFHRMKVGPMSMSFSWNSYRFYR